MPKISIVVPVYGVELYLRRCIDSILSQSLSNWDLILVDDGSPDCCGRICDEYSKVDNRIFVLHQENGGLSRARNAGVDYALAHSDSEYITFVDSDDWIEQDYLRVLVEGLSFGVDVACVSYAQVCESGIRYVRYRDSGWKVLSPEDYWVGADSTAQIPAWCKLYKKDLFAEVRYPGGRLMEDAFTTHRLLFQVKRLAMREVPLYNYFVGSQSITRSPWSRRRLDAVAAFEEQQKYFANAGLARAAEFARRQTLVVMAQNMAGLRSSAPDLYDKYNRRIRSEMASGGLPFWECREIYRCMMTKGFRLRWLFAMIANALMTGRNSWLAREGASLFLFAIRRRLERVKIPAVV